MIFITGKSTSGRFTTGDRRNEWFSRAIRLLASIYVMMSLAPASTATATEVEPNDALDTATTVPLSHESDTIFADQWIGDGDQAALDVDLFVIEIPDDWFLPAILYARAATDAPVDLMLRLFDASGTELANNDDWPYNYPVFPISIPRINALLFTRGPYYVGVSSAANPRYDPHQAGSGRGGAGGAYTLELNVGAAWLEPSPREPNDTAGTATWMGYEGFHIADESMGDGANGRRDVDIYRLKLLTPARLDVTASSSDGLLDPVVRLRSCDTALPTPTQDDDCLLGSADDGQDGSRDASVSVAVFEPGDVYIMVSGAGNRAYDPTVAGSGEFGSVGYYDLSVTVSGLSPVAPGEPNDSIPTATQLPLLVEGRPDPIVIGAFLGDGPYATLRGDRDFYAVRLLDESRVLNIDVQAASIGSDFRPQLLAYDLQGRIRGIADGSVTGDAHLTLPARCILAYPEGEGRSLILTVMGTMQRRPNDPFDPFVPSPSYPPVQDHHVTDGPGNTGPYRLVVSTNSVFPACPVEPNDNMESAAATGLFGEGTYSCSSGFLGDSQCLSQYNDLDVWYVETTTASAELRVDVSGCGFPEEAASAVRAHVFDRKGNPIVSSASTDIRGGESIILSTLLGGAGRYYVAVTPFCSGGAIDLSGACSNYCGADPGFYDITISLVEVRSQASAAAANAVGWVSGNRFFATRLDSAANAIDLFDSESGNLLSSLDAPEPRFGGSGGLATNGDNLFLLGAGRFPTLYRMDPATGDVLDKYFTWFGSGYFSDATMLGGEMYLLDYRQRRVHVVDPFEPRYLRSLSLGTMHGITIGGGLASLSGPNRLYVADAFNTRSIYEVYPATGALTATLPPTDNRPTALAGIGSSRLFVGDFRTEAIDVIDRMGGAVYQFAVDAPVGALAGVAGIGLFADFDADGDVDLKDLAAFQICFSREDVAATECARGDEDGDDGIDLLDAIAIPGASTGP